eukprot:COSAG01_NODE_4258_length_5201_cov_4.634065_6_plen_143_part_00
MSRAFPSWTRSILTEIYLCHACSYHEIEDGNARAGERATAIMHVVNGSKSALTPAVRTPLLTRRARMSGDQGDQGDSFQVELNRHLYFKADHHKVYDHDMKVLGRADPIAPGESCRDIQIDFVVPPTMPSTDGHYIDCKCVD